MLLFVAGHFDEAERHPMILTIGSEARKNCIEAGVLPRAKFVLILILHF